MLELGQFHLQLAFGTLGTQGKDIEDQAGAIDHPAVERPLFQISFLGGEMFVIEMTRSASVAAAKRKSLAPCPCRRKSWDRDCGGALDEFGADFATRRSGQQADLFELVVVVALAEIELTMTARSRRRALKHLECARTGLGPPRGGRSVRNSTRQPPVPAEY